MSDNSSKLRLAFRTSSSTSRACPGTTSEVVTVCYSQGTGPGAQYFMLFLKQGSALAFWFYCLVQWLQVTYDHEIDQKKAALLKGCSTVWYSVKSSGLAADYLCSRSLHARVSPVRRMCRWKATMKISVAMVTQEGFSMVQLYFCQRYRVGAITIWHYL